MKELNTCGKVKLCVKCKFIVVGLKVMGSGARIAF